jgi:hypothetical protein
MKMSGLTLTPAIAADIPTIESTLKILLPTIFPTLKSRCFYFAATTDVINSGNDFPMATIVRPTILSKIPIEVAIMTALSSVNVAPR